MVHQGRRGGYAPGPDQSGLLLSHRHRHGGGAGRPSLAGEGGGAGPGRAQSLLGRLLPGRRRRGGRRGPGGGWYGKAAKQNYPPAICGLGLAFELGRD